MTNLPRLELYEDRNKKNDFIIFRQQIKDKKSSVSKKTTSKNIKRTYRKSTTKSRKKRKSIFNIF